MSWSPFCSKLLIKEPKTDIKVLSLEGYVTFTNLESSAIHELDIEIVQLKENGNKPIQENSVSCFLIDKIIQAVSWARDGSFMVLSSDNKLYRRYFSDSKNRNKAELHQGRLTIIKALTVNRWFCYFGLLCRIIA